MRYAIFFLLSVCLSTNKGSTNPFSNLKDKAVLAAGGLMQKKENNEFFKYRNHPTYSTFFEFSITSVKEFKNVLDQYNQQVQNWNARSVYTLNEQVPTLHARVEEPRLFARTYNLLEYMLKQNFQDSLPAKARVEKFLNQCRPKSPAMAEQEIKKGKDFQGSEYLFLSPNCSKEAHSILTSEQKNINTFLSYALPQANKLAQVDPAMTADNDSAKSASVNDTPFSALRKKCIASPTPECLSLVRNVYYNITQRPMTLMLYGNGSPLTPIVIDDTITNLFKTCSDPKNFADQRCQQFAQKVAQTWQELDPEQKNDLIPNPQAYLLGHEDVLDKTFSESDFKAQVAFNNYMGYKDVEDIFNQIYSMSCAVDITYRMRLSPTEEASFVEQQIAVSDSKVAQNARSVISNVTGKIQSLSQSNNNVASKVGNAGGELISANSSSSIVENEDIYLAPGFIHYYIQDWDKLADKEIQISATEKVKLQDLLKGLKPTSKKLLQQNNIVIEVDYATLFGIFSKICISILGPEYLKAEVDISKALQEQNEQNFENSIKNAATQLKEDSSKKDSRAFRYLPSSEYNKVRQIALIMLTNMHVILLDDRLKRQGKHSPFHIVADQLRQAFQKQLTFFARYIYALKFQKYEANSLSMSPFNSSFTENFIKCIYPISDSDIATLVDADGTNMYSLYTSYLIGSTYGVIDDEGEKNIFLDNRSAKNRLVGDFKKTFGAQAELSIQGALKGGINAGLQTLTPLPPVLTSMLATGATMALMAGPEQVYKMMKNTCRFNKDKCIAMKLQKVDLTRPLDTRITEFLMAFGEGLQKQIRKPGATPKSQKFDPIMPTLFILENEDSASISKFPPTSLTNIDEVFQALFQRTQNYYNSLSRENSAVALDSKSPQAAKNESTDLTTFDDSLEKFSGVSDITVPHPKIPISDKPAFSAFG
jgi:hypothetical protein